MGARPLGASKLPGGVAYDPSQPGADVLDPLALLSQRHGPRLLHHVVDALLIEDQAARQTPHPTRMGQELLTTIADG